MTADCLLAAGGFRPAAGDLSYELLLDALKLQASRRLQAHSGQPPASSL